MCKLQPLTVCCAAQGHCKREKSKQTVRQHCSDLVRFIIYSVYVRDDESHLLRATIELIYHMYALLTL